MAAERRDPLASIIDAILDGRPAEWPGEESASELDAEDQRALEPLRVLAAIASVQSPLGLSSLDDHGRFELRERLGEGASGTVYQARDLRLDRDVALKIVPLDRPFAGSVLAEARRLARVKHPNVVTIYDVYETPLEGRICMELLSGPTLARVLEARRLLSVPEVLDIGRSVARALGAIHGAGLVHGDIKPSNVVVEESGRVVVTDFGAGTDIAQGSATVRAGTPGFMAPEVAAGRPARPESDIFSLGTLLFHLLTGRYSTRYDEAPGASAQESVRSALRQVPAPIRQVVVRALHPDPLARFRSAVEFEAELMPPAGASRPVILAVLMICVAGLCAVAWTAGHHGESPFQRAVEREVKLPADFDGIGELLEDSSWMAFSTNRGGVGIFDTRSGASRTLVVGAAGASVRGKVLVRSVQQTAVFGWMVPECECVELREVPLSGGAARGLLRTPFTDLSLAALTADGSQVLFVSPAVGPGRKLIVADLARGTFSEGIPVSQTLQSADISPDGRFIAFDSDEDGDRTGDLFVAEVASGKKWSVLDGRPDDLSPMWLTDGGGLVFSSDRAGGPGLWRLDLQEGRPDGDPMLVERDMGRFIPLSMTSSGAMSYWRSPVTDIATARFDEVTGRVVGPSRALPVRIAGSNTAPCWAASGDAVVYASERRPTGAGRSILVVHSLTDGREQEVSVPVDGLLEPSCAPVGPEVLIRGPGLRDNVRGARVVDYQSGRITATFPFPAVNLTWAADGRSFYALDPQGIYRVERQNGKRTRLPLGAWKPFTLALSPDGTHIAASASRDDAGAVIVGPSTGEMSEEVYRVSHADLLPRVVQWTADGSKLLAIEPAPTGNGTSSGSSYRLVTINVHSGAIAEAGLERPGLSWVRLSKDGRQIAYRTGLYRRTLWIRENVVTTRSQR